ncbi:hypothetical protein [Streptomyces chromofuscus]|uniref:Uncharacterized protein n=1 Tax=Streptomyces chromofuscus TaxID=42881 RepID=A0A7M2TI58_STRCW|nr:hypothetical protein [Streptomyces chromofuscus]QOV47914.1 hypothetical protein IPT68_10445 [Streptomyces chromofuscus]GGS95763.1 hypothetical protein GCM10010254_14620 [Streptomyces chromofuscus]
MSDLPPSSEFDDFTDATDSTGSHDLGLRGRAVLAVPGTDAVVPSAVREAVQDALATRARYTRFELPADHSPGLWRGTSSRATPSR